MEHVLLADPEKENMRQKIKLLLALLYDLTDTDKCQLDHLGYCQAHGWMSTTRCPHEKAQELLQGRMLMEYSGRGLDQILYEAYCERAEWKSAVTGAPLPQWADCSKVVKDCWWAAAEAAIEWVDDVSSRQHEESIHESNYR